MHSWSKPHKIILIVSAITITASVGILLWIFLQTPRNTALQTANEITSFTPYYFTKGLPRGFSDLEESAQHTKGIFIFQIKDAGGKKVTITQQPQAADTSGSPQGSEKVEGVSGTAAISFAEGQIIGTLVTDKKTLVLLTAESAVGSDAVKDLMRNLHAVK